MTEKPDHLHILGIIVKRFCVDFYLFTRSYLEERGASWKTGPARAKCVEGFLPA